MEDLRRCVYCNHEKPVSEFSLEHIFPDSMGGALCDMTFKTHFVCRSCNSTCGIWVDAPVIKNWFSKNYNFDMAREFIDFENGSTLPFMYMGIFEEFNTENQVCELWIGPTGDTIYYFRKKYDSSFDTIVGGNFIDQKKNPGTAYIFITTDNKDWGKIVLLSFKEHFKRARRISGNVGLSDENDKIFFNKPTKEEIETRLALKNYNGGEHKTKMTFGLGSEQRFLAKLALGVGFNLLGLDYLDSPYALELRKCLWEKDYQKRCSLKVRGTGFLNNNTDIQEIQKILCYKSAHLITILSTGKNLTIGLCLYGKLYSQIVISDDNQFWKNNSNLDRGLVYLLFPQIKESVGPFSLGKYITSQSSEEKIPEIELIEKKRIDLKSLPPFRSGNYK